MDTEYSKWNGYYIHGDIKEVDTIVESKGFIELDKEDVVSVLSADGENWITTGYGPSINKALDIALDNLPCFFGKTNNLLVEFLYGNIPPKMAHPPLFATILSESAPATKIRWGVSCDESLGDSFKVIIVASVNEKFIESYFDGIRECSPENPGISLSLKREQCNYWKKTVANDIDWSCILDYLRERIEHHIRYHRLPERFVNSKHYISRMELCCRLFELAAADFYDVEGVYVNARNFSRFVGPIFNEYHVKDIGKGDCQNYILSELRRAKAYKILWKFIDHNFPYWLD